MITHSQRVVIDTDMGVDDAAAVAWLITQRDYPIEVAGISAVWGNTSIDYVTGNVLSLLAALGREGVPVVCGEARPLHARRTSVGAMIHGQDGLWGAGRRFVSDHPAHDVAAFYRLLGESTGRDGDSAATESQTAELTLLALGPLTNLAKVLDADPSALRVFSNIVILGGAHRGGGITPTAETNFWHDPEAAQRVLAAGLPITLVTRDAHRMFTLTTEDLRTIIDSPRPAARFLAKPLRAYADVQMKYGSVFSCADVVAAISAADPSVCTTTRSGLVKVVASEDPLVRGQSVMGFSMQEKLTMIEPPSELDPLIQRCLTDPSFNFDAALGAILAREPDNANVVLAIDEARVRSTFLRAILGK